MPPLVYCDEDGVGRVLFEGLKNWEFGDALKITGFEEETAKPYAEDYLELMGNVIKSIRKTGRSFIERTLREKVLSFYDLEEEGARMDKVASAFRRTLSLTAYMQSRYVIDRYCLGEGASDFLNNTNSYVDDVRKLL